MVSLAPFVNKRPWLQKLLMPVSNWYAGASGYRQLGLRYDDLFEEEREAVQIALTRISNKEAYERVYRIRRATQCSYQHKLLPRSDWTTDATDIRYLSPIIRQVEAEEAERNALDAASIVRKN
ncbi:ubiquinol-cytochrome c reductase subunit 7 [Geosmithia morbida]|uniref:Cytochrome b-c1 complex subunit 7 n=1 Tax=Geosmithia morbida TaxID=1094350 RepID=A0A9P4YQI5_9HYPO|nr:ubiquinol-cytochrome c reductase subunit 7 [Geosmithia morbida]KAF4119962.1 ubiquinol-cytochrome c reductase subunit 7 [Geosmithia morbida]